jgi:hypothetical protein
MSDSFIKTTASGRKSIGMKERLFPTLDFFACHRVVIIAEANLKDVQETHLSPEIQFHNPFHHHQGEMDGSHRY